MVRFSPFHHALHHGVRVLMVQPFVACQDVQQERNDSPRGLFRRIGPAPERSSHPRRPGGFVAPEVSALLLQHKHSPFPPPELFLLSRRRPDLLGVIGQDEARYAWMRIILTSCRCSAASGLFQAGGPRAVQIALKRGSGRCGGSGEGSRRRSFLTRSRAASSFVF